VISQDRDVEVPGGDEALGSADQRRPTKEDAMSDTHDPHAGLHSEQGARPGEHPGRAANPIVKVDELATST
jgi:hypothetical protein